jgi:hypothetical protein
MQHVDLDHLRDVLDEMSGLSKREDSEESDPWRRDETIGVSRGAGRHP